MIKKSLLIWLSIIPLAILNAGLREKVLTPLVGAGYSLPISGISLCVLIFFVSLVFVPKLGEGTPRTYWLMGLVWVVLTLIFETGLGFLMGKTLAEVMESYDVRTGNLWLPVVSFIGCAPRLASRLKHVALL